AAERSALLARGMSPVEGADAFVRILAGIDAPQVAVSTTPLGPLPEEAVEQPAAGEGEDLETTVHDRAALGAAYEGQTNEIEERIAAVWQRLFGIDRLGRHDDFFALGGHSLLATQLVARIRAEFQIELPLEALFDAPTIAGLSEAVLAKLLQ